MASVRKSISAAAFVAATLAAGPAFAVCGDPTGDGEVTTADALYTLRAGVDQVGCALSVCDVDGNGELNAADALRVLRSATGLPPALACLGVPTDPDYVDQWGPPAINAPAVWSVRTDCSDITVAVIDTGVDFWHDDLRENLWRNPGEIAFNEKDDDGNGFVDDVYGWDFVDNDQYPWDPQGHGTHVAGTIGAVGNSMGVVGICWKASIMTVRFLDEIVGGSSADGLQAIDYARKNGAHILNNSWGGGPPDSGLFFALNAADDAGILSVVAAGNDGKDTDVYWDYPGHYQFIKQINVAASTEDGGLAGFSNYGRTSVHVTAPGSDIFSTIPKDEFDFNSGTSMAAPHVAGAAALLMSEFPLLSALDIKRILMDTVSVSSEFDGTVTSGQIDLEAAFAEADFVQAGGGSLLASLQDEPRPAAAPEKVKSRKLLKSYSGNSKFPKLADVEETLPNGKTKKSTIVEDHVVVILDDESAIDTLEQQGFRIRKRLTTEQPIVLVEAPTGVNEAEAQLSNVAGVVNVSPDYFYKPN